MKVNVGGVEGKEFNVNADKITDETKKQGWPIDGKNVVVSYRRLMDQ